MAHAVIWKYVDKESGEVKVLTGHPGAFAETEDKAVEDARHIKNELPDYDLTPLCVAEMDADITEDIYEKPEIYLGPEDDDEIFYDISSMSCWQRKDWWPL